jgi:hypothetical protein
MSSKFAINDESTQYISDASNTFLTTPYQKDITRTFSPDDITECSRKLYYQSIGGKFDQPYSNSEFLSDHFTKTKWIHILKQIKDIKVIDTWVVASDCNYNLHTKIDCVIEIPSLDNIQFIVNVKSLSPSDFAHISSNGPTRKDIIRSVVDMWLVELGNGIIIYENRASLDFMIFRVLPHNAIINSIKVKAKDLLQFVLKGLTPPRSYKMQTAKECIACTFCKRCWEKE